MKKRYLALLTCLFISIACNKMISAKENKEVEVSIPSFDVKVNGVKFENQNNQYPLLFYKQIVYFPMTYDYSRFLGIKANWYDKQKVLFVGVADNKSEKLSLMKREDLNRFKYNASIVDYDIAINTVEQRAFWDNNEQEYPVLNFRNITYIPLTWNVAVEELGWQYEWDSMSGLSINSNSPFRPIINDTVLGNKMPNATASVLRYHYGSNYYIGYPVSTLDGRYQFEIRKRGEEKNTYNLMKYLSDGDYYFNQTLDSSKNKNINLKPIIDEEVFVIKCYRINDTKTNLKLYIDLSTGEVVKKEEF